MCFKNFNCGLSGKLRLSDITCADRCCTWLIGRVFRFNACCDHAGSWIVEWSGVGVMDRMLGPVGLVWGTVQCNAMHSSSNVMVGLV
jgi:hypothetical protein